MNIIPNKNVYTFLQSLPILWLFSGFLFTTNSVNILIPFIIICLALSIIYPNSDSRYIPKLYLLGILALVIHILISDSIGDVSTREIRGYIISIIMLLIIPLPKVTTKRVILLLILSSICSLIYTYYYSIYSPTLRSAWPINPIPHATLTAAIASLSLVYILSTNISLKLRFCATLAFSILLISIFLTQSRGPILAISISSFLTIIISIYSRSTSYKAILLIIPIIALGATLTGPKLIERYNKTVFEISNINSHVHTGSIGIRLDLWKTAFNVIKSQPLTGGGRDLRPHIDELYKDGVISKTTYKFNPSHYHNQYLDSWAKNGILFFLLTLFILFYPIYFYIKNKSLHSLLSFNISIIYIITSLTDVPLHSTTGIIFYIFIQCLLLSLDRKIKNDALQSISHLFRPFKYRNIRNFYYAYIKYGSIQLLTNCHFTTKNSEGVQIEYFWKKSTIFPHPVGIVIGKNVKLGNKCKIFQNVTIGEGKTGYPEIGDNVTIYANSMIFGGIKIGNNAIIPPHSIVNKDVQEYEIYKSK